MPPPLKRFGEPWSNTYKEATEQTALWADEEMRLIAEQNLEVLQLNVLKDALAKGEITPGQYADEAATILKRIDRLGRDSKDAHQQSEIWGRVAAKLKAKFSLGPGTADGLAGSGLASGPSAGPPGVGGAGPLGGGLGGSGLPKPRGSGGPSGLLGTSRLPGWSPRRCVRFLQSSLPVRDDRSRVRV